MAAAAAVKQTKKVKKKKEKEEKKKKEKKEKECATQAFAIDIFRAALAADLESPLLLSAACVWDCRRPDVRRPGQPTPHTHTHTHLC